MAGADGAGWTFYSTAPACPLLTNLPTSSNRPNILKEFKRYQIPFGKSFHKLLEVLVDVLVEVCQLSGFSIGIRAMVSRHLPQTCDISAFLDVSKWHNQWAFSHGFPMVFPGLPMVFQVQSWLPQVGTTVAGYKDGVFWKPRVCHLLLSH